MAGSFFPRAIASLRKTSNGAWTYERIDDIWEQVSDWMYQEDRAQDGWPSLTNLHDEDRICLDEEMIGGFGSAESLFPGLMLAWDFGGRGVTFDQSAQELVKDQSLMETEARCLHDLIWPCALFDVRPFKYSLCGLKVEAIACYPSYDEKTGTPCICAVAFNTKDGLHDANPIRIPCAGGAAGGEESRQGGEGSSACEAQGAGVTFREIADRAHAEGESLRRRCDSGFVSLREELVFDPILYKKDECEWVLSMLAVMSRGAWTPGRDGGISTVCVGAGLDEEGLAARRANYEERLKERAEWIKSERIVSLSSFSSEEIQKVVARVEAELAKNRELIDAARAAREELKREEDAKRQAKQDAKRAAKEEKARLRAERKAKNIAEAAAKAERKAAKLAAKEAAKLAGKQAVTEAAQLAASETVIEVAEEAAKDAATEAAPELTKLATVEAEKQAAESAQVADEIQVVEANQLEEACEPVEESQLEENPIETVHEVAEDGQLEEAPKAAEDNQPEEAPKAAEDNQPEVTPNEEAFETSFLAYENRRLARENRALRRELRIKSGRDELAFTMSLPTTPAEALDLAKSAFADRLFVLSAAEKSAASYRGDTNETWAVLRDMAAVLHPMIFDGDAKDPAAQFQAKTGFELALREVKQAKANQDLARLRRVEYEGELRDMTPHVKGKGTKRGCSLRVHFFADYDKRLLVIGHCGEHLTSYVTSKI